ncbi:hypothetical protein ACLOJK_039851 [Asimina triloba]
MKEHYEINFPVEEGMKERRTKSNCNERQGEANLLTLAWQERNKTFLANDVNRISSPAQIRRGEISAASSPRERNTSG